MPRITSTVPTAAVKVGCGIVLAAAALVGWHLGNDSAESSHRSCVPRAADIPAHAAPTADPHARPADAAPVSEFDRESERLRKQLDDIQERTAQAESSIPPVRERQTDKAAEMWKALDAKASERGWLSLPIYIKPIPIE